MNEAVVIMNEQHSLFFDQQRLLSQHFKSYKVLLVPKEGWTHAEMDAQIVEIMKTTDDIVFISPVPYMLMKTCKLVAGLPEDTRVVYLFHRDVRYKAMINDPESIPYDKLYHAKYSPWQLVS